jgi:hypothetical protein
MWLRLMLQHSTCGNLGTSLHVPGVWQETLKDSAKLYSLDKAMKVRTMCSMNSTVLWRPSCNDVIKLGSWLTCCSSLAFASSCR